MTDALLPVFQRAAMVFDHGEGAWLTTALVEALRRKARILTIAAGDNVTRVLPPLVVSDAEIRLFAEGLDRTLADL